MSLLERGASQSDEMFDTNPSRMIESRRLLAEAIENRTIGQDEVACRIVGYINMFQMQFMYGEARYECYGQEPQLIRKEIDQIAAGSKHYALPTIEDLSTALEAYSNDECGNALLSSGTSPMPRAITMVFFDEIEKML